MSISEISLKNLPSQPGVYFFKDKEKNIIYIGKAKNLKLRVSSYFKSYNHSAKTKVLVKNIEDLEYVLVDNELESLLLENRMIKQHKPKYNISLKDSKTYAYILLTEEKFPRILITRKVGAKGKYFGPYTDGFSRIELINLAVDLFKIRTCKKLPKRPCLNYHIGRCTAPCAGYASFEEYGNQVKDAISFLKGNRTDIMQKLQTQMKQCSKELKFEEALEKRRQIEAINHLNEKQKVERIVGFDQDIVACKKTTEKTLITLFSISKGIISGRKDFEFENSDGLFEEFIKLYYSQNKIPREIIVSEQFWRSEDERISLENYLETLKGGKTSIVYPKIGDKLGLVNLALKNIQVEGGSAALLELKEKLNLPAAPSTIECFDISNLSYDHVVGAMVQFIDGAPNRSGYRKFEIKSFKGADDFAAIGEIVLRRYKRLIEENSKMPDLIIIDGGLGQLGSALESLKSLGLAIPTIALAKKNEEIFVPGMNIPIRMNKNSEMMLLLRNIRDCVHRFAISYNKKKRQMRLKDEFKSAS